MRAYLLLCAWLLSGCAAGPDFKPPAAPYIDHYPVIRKTQSQQLVEGMDIPAKWWELFHSQQLNELIVQAIKANPDLHAAQAALHGANEILYAGQGALYPSVDATIEPSRQKTSTDAGSYNLHTASLNVGYHFDIFGGTSRNIESLQAQAGMTRFQLEAAYLSLTGNIVNCAIQEASLREQMTATQQIIDINIKILAIMQRQQVLGQTAMADSAAQVALLAQSRVALPPLEKQLAQQRDMLTMLLGKLPIEVLKAHFELSSLQLPAILPLSLPARLVAQRPDIRAARENLHMASAGVGIAMAARLPDISLSAALGSSASSQLFSAGTGFWTLTGNIVAPIFHGGALLYQQRAAEAGFEQANNAYRSTVLSAFREVADTLHAIDSDARTYSAAQTAEDASARSLEIAVRQLELGDISRNTQLLAQQAYQSARLTRIQAQANRLMDTVALFQALGGGWWNRTDEIRGE
jgi:NodT family efflux transporter outer membrane factor (OMF) lipoprotein